MGVFGHKKKSAKEEALLAEQLFFDENFREELRNHGRLYFEKVINENGALFKQELDATIQAVNGELKGHITAQLDAAINDVKVELKSHVTQQLDEQLGEYVKATKEAQDQALKTMVESAAALEQHQQQLGQSLEKTITDQEAILNGVFEESKSEIAKMKDTQALSLQWLARSVQALQQQHEQLEQTLAQSVDKQTTLLVGAFEQNMATIIEQYLLKSLGDQYDLKAQLPGIIKQMEANKQAMTDDMKL